MTRLRVLFAYLHSARSAGPRYRVLQFIPMLDREHMACTTMAMQSDASTDRSVRSVLLPRPLRTLHNLVVWLQSLVFQCRIVWTARQFDRVVLHRVPMSGWARWLLRGRRADIINDFDDALDTYPVDKAEWLGGTKRAILRRGLENAILVSATTVTSNTHNRAVVERLGRRAVVIPTSVDLTRVRFRSRREPVEPRLVIGWIGTPSTAFYLAPIEDALAAVVAAYRPVIRLVGAGRSPFVELDAEIVDWSLDREVADVDRFDIGLMPMQDTPWTRGKAVLKALQYGASGAPTVASLTSTNLDMLGEGEGALFASTTSEWITALSRLINDAEERAEMGRRGRERVARLYSLEVNAPRLARVIRDPAGTGGEPHL